MRRARLGLVGVVLLGAAGLAGAAARHADPLGLGFTEGTAPLAVSSSGLTPPTAARCGRCHEAEYADWERSRHRVAHSNEIYVAGLIDEPQPFCVHCHAPLAVQAAEVLPNLPWYAAHDPRRGVDELPVKGEETWAEEGITCAVCHWRDGEVLTARASGASSPHPVREVAGLDSPDLCRGCHEFRMPAFDAAGLRLTDTPMQTTWSEWEAYAAAGGEGTCQSCHMPEGRHLFHGAHDLDLLRGSVDVRARRGRGQARFTLRSVGAGHHVPTGDLFRNMTLEVSADRARWEVVDRVGRSFELQVDPVTGDSAKVLAADTSLRPGVPREVAVPREGRLWWRLRFHYGAAHDEARGLVPLDALVVTLHEGRL